MVDELKKTGRRDHVKIIRSRVRGRRPGENQSNHILLILTKRLIVRVKDDALVAVIEQQSEPVERKVADIARQFLRT
jgi:hypothetical protein